jgi:hypothetical protein
MFQGGLGGLLALGLLWAALGVTQRDVLAASDLLGRAPLALSSWLAVLLVVGGMAVGVVGSLVSLGRSRV